ncbi:hypothetical protein L4C36_14000 [Photobacterium japonica]|uniref:hypothetical protein n=1 Tax=Photobacterium japonica TaxID=2910235 RepID=UPI003D10B711
MQVFTDLLGFYYQALTVLMPDIECPDSQLDIASVFLRLPDPYTDTKKAAQGQPF